MTGIGYPEKFSERRRPLEPYSTARERLFGALGRCYDDDPNEKSGRAEKHPLLPSEEADGRGL